MPGQSTFVARTFDRMALVGRPVLCFYCQRPVIQTQVVRPDQATIDHWIPTSRGGDRGPINMVIACLDCNLAKGCMTGPEFIPIMGNRSLCFQRSREIQLRISPVQPTYGSRAEKIAVKRERREERLTQRLRIPDPNCPHCRGTGRITMNRATGVIETGNRHYCRCALAPVSSDLLDELS